MKSHQTVRRHAFPAKTENTHRPSRVCVFTCSTCASVSWPGTCCASQLALNYQTKLPLRPTCGSALGLRPASCTSRRYFSMVWCRFWYGKAADGTWGSIFLVPSVEYRNAHFRFCVEQVIKCSASNPSLRASSMISGFVSCLWCSKKALVSKLS